MEVQGNEKNYRYGVGSVFPVYWSQRIRRGVPRKGLYIGWGDSEGSGTEGSDE